MKKSTSTVIISFGIIQCLAVIGLMTFMQCKKTEPKPLKDTKIQSKALVDMAIAVGGT